MKFPTFSRKVALRGSGCVWRACLCRVEWHQRSVPIAKSEQEIRLTLASGSSQGHHSDLFRSSRR